jgi:two-component system LytT family sensor kinase
MSPPTNGVLRPAQTWLLIFAVWTAVGLFLAAQTSFAFGYFGRPEPFSRALRIHMTCVWTWFAFTPLILAWSRRIGFSAPARMVRVSAHVALSVAFSLAGFVIFIAVEKVLGIPRARGPWLTSLTGLAIAQLHVDVLRYWVVVGIDGLLRYHRQLRERERAAAALQTELAEARLESLKRQLHPHFLFNTLNSISVLMYEDVTTAHRMLIRLSELLRNALKAQLPDEVTVEEEVRFLQKYLEIEKLRFGGRLQIELDVAPDALDARVPNLILQPLVENALKHGAGVIDRPTCIAVRVARLSSGLHLEVSDDGAGPPEQIRVGVGLANTMARLQHLYGERQKLELRRPAGGGFAVDIMIPHRRERPA